MIDEHECIYECFECANKQCPFWEQANKSNDSDSVRRDMQREIMYHRVKEYLKHLPVSGEEAQDEK